MKKIKGIICCCLAISWLCSCSAIPFLPADSSAGRTVRADSGDRGRETVEPMEKNNKGKSYSQDRIDIVKEELTAYLEKKYNETFKVTETGIKGLLVKNDYIVAYSKTHPEEYFNAYISEDGTMSDEYYAVLNRTETGAYIQDIVEPLAGDCFVSARLYCVLGEEFTSSLPLEEGIKKVLEEGGRLKITGNIYIRDHGETEAQLAQTEEKIKEALEREGLDGSYGIYHIVTEVNETMTLEQLSQLRVRKENFDWKSDFVIKPD